MKNPIQKGGLKSEILGQIPGKIGPYGAIEISLVGFLVQRIAVVIVGSCVKLPPVSKTILYRETIDWLL